MNFKPSEREAVNPNRAFWLVWRGKVCPLKGLLPENHGFHWLLPLSALILIVGCATAIPEKPIVQTVEIKVPVSVPCRVTIPEKPLFELDRTSPDASLFDLAKAAIIEIKQRRAFQAELEAAAKSCS